jgi:hypothetical protein
VILIGELKIHEESHDDKQAIFDWSKEILEECAMLHHIQKK